MPNFTPECEAKFRKQVENYLVVRKTEYNLYEVVNTLSDGGKNMTDHYYRSQEIADLARMQEIDKLVKSHPLYLKDQLISMAQKIRKMVHFKNCSHVYECPETHLLCSWFLSMKTAVWWSIAIDIELLCMCIPYTSESYEEYNTICKKLATLSGTLRYHRNKKNHMVFVMVGHDLNCILWDLKNFMRYKFDI